MFFYIAFLWPGGLLCVIAYYLLLTHREKQTEQLDIHLDFQCTLFFLCLVLLPLMIPIFTIGIVQILVSRMMSRRTLSRIKVGDVLSCDRKGTTFTVVSVARRVLLESKDNMTITITNELSTRSSTIPGNYIAYHDIKDMASWIPSCELPTRVVRRVGRVQVVDDLKTLSRVLEHGSRWWDNQMVVSSVTSAQLIFELERPVKYIQRTWRKRRDQRRLRASKVIATAVLYYMYRPGGRMYAEARGRFEDSVVWIAVMFCQQ